MIRIEHSYPFFVRMVATGLFGALLTTAATAAATQDSVEDVEVPTRIVIPTDPEHYPDPGCWGCKIVVKRPSEGDGTRGSLRVTHDEQTAFTGSIVIIVSLLDARDRRTVVLEDVLLPKGETTELLVPAGEGWSWYDVESVAIELVPAP